MYTDSTLTTKFEPIGRDNSYRPAVNCSGIGVGLQIAVSENCYRQDDDLGIQYICNGLPSNATPQNFNGNPCTP
jgi:hypothetical protein